MTRKKPNLTALKITFVIILLIILASIIASSFYIYDIGFKRKTPDLYTKTFRLAEKLLQSEQSQTIQSIQAEQAFSVMTLTEPLALDQTINFEQIENSQSWSQSEFYETWTIASEDKLNLVGYYYPAKVPTTKTAIMAHGYGGRGMEMEQFARFYSEKLGFNVLLPDARGHGASEGNYIGFGWPDRKDYLLWIQKIIDSVGRESQIVLHGLSMGASTVMMASGENLPEQVKVIIEDSGFTSVYDELAYQLRQIYMLPAFPFISATSLLTDIKAGYNFHEASSLRQVEKNKTPMLFIHGASDSIVPVEMAWKLFDTCKVDKQIYLVPGAGHGMAYEIDRPAYETIVSEFISRFIVP
ncbi:MAG TPA: alpha/beta hydrolase [Peptococcaceae bacterium]|nr:alpha/beta hydrolase [Peptococcaceae bacterium]